MSAQTQLFPYSGDMAGNMILGQLLTNHILDRRILQAMHDIPRAPFLPESLRGAAYVDEDLEIAPGRWLMAPLTFARLLDLAAMTPGCRGLVIGDMSGYSAAVMSRLTGHVTAIDTDAAFFEKAQAHIKRLQLSNVEVKQLTSLAAGYAPGAPYDAIVICGAVEFIPETLGAQLAIGGRLVTVRRISSRADAPLGLGKGLLVEKLDRQLQCREHFDAAAAVLPGFERREAFAL